MNFENFTFRITRNGDKNSQAIDSEVIVLQAYDVANDNLIILNEFERNDNVIDDGITFSRGEKMDGVLKLGFSHPIIFESKDIILSLLRHPYSGIVQIDTDFQNYAVDLYSENAGTFNIHLVSGEPARIVSPDYPHAICPQYIKAPHVLEIKCLDTANPRSSGIELQVIEIMDTLRHFPVSWDSPQFKHLDIQRNTIGHSQRRIPTTIRIYKGEVVPIRVTSPCPAIKLLRHAYSGKVRLKLGDCESVIDLYSHTNHETVYVAAPESGQFLPYSCTSDVYRKQNSNSLPSIKPLSMESSALQFLEIEESSLHFISGWACDLGQADTVHEVELLRNGEMVYHTPADLPRPELAVEKGIPQTKCGFRIPVPPDLTRYDQLKVRLAGTLLSIPCFEFSLRNSLFATAAKYPKVSDLIAHIKA